MLRSVISRKKRAASGFNEHPFPACRSLCARSAHSSLEIHEFVTVTRLI
jgi:hypothetical protein